jgi:hypothetical protein
LQSTCLSQRFQCGVICFLGGFCTTYYTLDYITDNRPTLRASHDRQAQEKQGKRNTIKKAFIVHAVFFGYLLSRCPINLNGGTSVWSFAKITKYLGFLIIWLYL